MMTRRLTGFHVTRQVNRTVWSFVQRERRLGRCVVCLNKIIERIKGEGFRSPTMKDVWLKEDPELVPF